MIMQLLGILAGLIFMISGLLNQIMFYIPGRILYTIGFRKVGKTLQKRFVELSVLDMLNIVWFFTRADKEDIVSHPVLTDFFELCSNKINQIDNLTD